MADEPLGDFELIAAYRDGDTEAGAELWRRHHPAALSYARRLAGASGADDIAAEAFTRVLSAIAAGRGPTEAFRSYLMSTVHNVFVSQARSESRTRPTDQVDLIADSQVRIDTGEDASVLPLVSAAFATLPERSRAILWFTIVEGESLETAGSYLGITPAAAGALAYRARNTFYDALVATPGFRSTACSHVRTLIDLAGTDTLTRRQRRIITEHTRTCRECREAMAVPVAARMPVGRLAVLIAAAVGAAGYATLRAPAAEAAVVAGAAAGGTSPSGGRKTSPKVLAVGAVAAALVLVVAVWAVVILVSRFGGGDEGASSVVPPVTATAAPPATSPAQPSPAEQSPSAPSVAPTTSAPTAAPTTGAPSVAPTTSAPAAPVTTTSAPTTTAAPNGQSTTSAPAGSATTSVPTTAPRISQVSTSSSQAGSQTITVAMADATVGDVVSFDVPGSGNARLAWGAGQQNATCSETGDVTRCTLVGPVQGAPLTLTLAVPGTLSGTVTLQSPGHPADSHPLS